METINKQHQYSSESQIFAEIEKNDNLKNLIIIKKKELKKAINSEKH